MVGARNSIRQSYKGIIVNSKFAGKTSSEDIKKIYPINDRMMVLQKTD
jgi:hypothetical protein